MAIALSSTEMGDRCHDLRFLHGAHHYHLLVIYVTGKLFALRLMLDNSLMSLNHRKDFEFFKGDQILTSNDDLDAELQRLKEKLLHPEKLPVSLDYEEVLKLGIQSLQESLTVLDDLYSDLKNRCQVSMSKATVSHDKAQSALLDQDMALVFQHSIDKQVHIRLVQALKTRAEQIEATKQPLRQRLTQLENLLRCF